MTWKYISILLLLLLAATPHCILSAKVRRCKNLTYEVDNSPLEIYWINMDQSLDRRSFMQNHLGFYGLWNNHRVRALTTDQLVTNFKTVDEEGCSFGSEPSGYHIPSKSDGIKPMMAKNRTSAFYLMSKGKKVNVEMLCGRPKNHLRELVVSLSHLNAINYASSQNIDSGVAVSSNATDSSIDLSQYALVLEDDLQFAFEVSRIMLCS